MRKKERRSIQNKTCKTLKRRLPTSERYIDVETTLKKRYVPAGNCYQEENLIISSNRERSKLNLILSLHHTMCKTCNKTGWLRFGYNAYIISLILLLNFMKHQCRRTILVLCWNIPNVLIKNPYKLYLWNTFGSHIKIFCQKKAF